MSKECPDCGNEAPFWGVGTRGVQGPVVYIYYRCEHCGRNVKVRF